MHVKGKHNGGTKTERDKYAREFTYAKENGWGVPTTLLNLYPGFEQYAEQNFSSKAIAEKEREELNIGTNIVKIVVNKKETRLQSQPIFF